jgi:hypothetical protein
VGIQAQPRVLELDSIFFYLKQKYINDVSSMSPDSDHHSYGWKIEVTPLLVKRLD